MKKIDIFKTSVAFCGRKTGSEGVQYGPLHAKTLKDWFLQKQLKLI